MRATMHKRVRHRLHAGADDGFSLVMVVTSFAVLFALVLVTSLYVVRSIRSTATYTDSELALAAAESGIADYLSRAGADPGYWESTDCTNEALREPVASGTSTGCTAWDSHPQVGWAAVEPGASTESEPAYHYTVLGWDTQNGSEASWISLQVTGRVGDQYRTLEVQATRTSTEQYAGYQNHWAVAGYGGSCTDSSGARAYQWTAEMYESGNNVSAKPSVTCLYTLAAATSTNGWGGTDGATISSSGNGLKAWATNSWVEPITGDFFSNDVAFLSPGPTSMGATYQVSGRLTLANPWCTVAPSASALGVTSTSCDVLPTTSYTSGGYPVSRVAVGEGTVLSSSRTLPYTTSALADAPGCRYYGPTRIVMLADGTMKVWSKQSVYAGLTLAVGTGSTAAPSCGDPSDLASDAGAVVDLPAGMVVYVQDLPAGVAADNGVVNGRLDAHEIGGDAEHGYLPAGDVVADLLAGATVNENIYFSLDSTTWSSAQYRTQGNLWVEGEYGGSVTLGSEGTVFVTGDLVAAQSSDAQLGVVASAVTVADQRVMVGGRVTLLSDGSSWGGGLDTVSSSPNYRYVAGVDAGSGSLGDWPHDYDGDAAQVRIEAAIQVLEAGLGYQDALVCQLNQMSNMGFGGQDGWLRALGGESLPYYYAFPLVTVGERSSSGTRRVTVETPAKGELELKVVVVGSLAQNYLSRTGMRNEALVAVNYQGGADRNSVVSTPVGSCGMDVTVTYDDRLQTSSPPYLLRFTDVGWERGESSEVSTPDRLRS